MATVSGLLSHVTGDPDLVGSVGVASERVRPGKGGVITARPKIYKVTDGKVSFPCEPGKAVITLHYLNNVVDAIPIVVGEKSSYTLEDVVRAGELADSSTQRELEILVTEVRDLIDSSAADRRAASSSASQAASSASAAKTSETNAASSASRASSSASSASTSASAAKTSETNAASSASAAKADAGRAESAKTSASSSASAAKTSENAARGHADRAASIASSTSWSGDKLTVNGKTSPSLTGPKGDPGPKGKDGEVSFEALTPAQKKSLKGDRGPAGVVVSTQEPADKNLVWVDPSGANLDLLSNGFFVMTDAEALALSGKVPKDTFIFAVQSRNLYREE